MKQMNEIDIAVLKKRYRYNPETGVLVWIRLSCVNGARYWKPPGNKSKCGYVRLYIKGRIFPLHRVCWALHYGEWPKGQIDHINGVRDDNRIENLRCVRHGDNMRNMKMNKRNTSGVTGVHRDKKKWRAVLRFNKKRIDLGVFSHMSFAKAVRRSVERYAGFHENHGRKV